MIGALIAFVLILGALVLALQGDGYADLPDDDDFEHDEHEDGGP